MTEASRATGHDWSYRFSDSDEVELERQQLPNDAAAEDHGRELSRATNKAIVIFRHAAHVEDWEYVTEVDERS